MSERGSPRLPVFTWLALVVIAVSAWLQWLWPWALLFAYWLVLGLVTGEAFLVRRIRRDEHPVTFWLIQATWLALSVYWVLYELWWRGVWGAARGMPGAL